MQVVDTVERNQARLQAAECAYRMVECRSVGNSLSMEDELCHLRYCREIVLYFELKIVRLGFSDGSALDRTPRAQLHFERTVC